MRAAFPMHLILTDFIALITRGAVSKYFRSPMVNIRGALRTHVGPVIRTPDSLRLLIHVHENLGHIPETAALKRLRHYSMFKVKQKRGCFLS